MFVDSGRAGQNFQNEASVQRSILSKSVAYKLDCLT